MRIQKSLMAQLKKVASGVLASFPDLRAHKLGVLRTVTTQVLAARTARKAAGGLAGRTFLDSALRLECEGFSPKCGY